MSNLLANRRDQWFLLSEQLGLDQLFRRKYADYSKKTIDEMLSEAEKTAAEVTVVYAPDSFQDDVPVGHVDLLSGLLASARLKKIYQEKGVDDSPGKQRALARENSDTAFYAGKVAAARYYAANILSAVKTHCETVKIGDKQALEIPEESFTV